MSRKSPETFLEQQYSRLLKENNFGCAPVCLQAILPWPAEPKTIEAVFHNVISIEDIADMISLECLNRDIGVLPVATIKGSAVTLVRDILSKCNQSKHFYFAGALLWAKNDPSKSSSHIIAVTSLRHAKSGLKATIIDTARTNDGPRAIPISHLDRLTIGSDHLNYLQSPFFGTARAIVLVGSTLPPPNFLSSRLTSLQVKREALIHQAQQYHQQEAENYRQYRRSTQRFYVPMAGEYQRFRR